jgi:hypothetical protein
MMACNRIGITNDTGNRRTPRFSGRETTNQSFKLTDGRHADSGPLQALVILPFQGMTQR